MLPSLLKLPFLEFLRSTRILNVAEMWVCQHTFVGYCTHANMAQHRRMGKRCAFPKSVATGKQPKLRKQTAT